jgi:hypothetical protein
VLDDKPNRRRHVRHRVVFPIKVSSMKKQGRIGMCRNGSASGMLLGTPSRFDLGDELILRFRVKSGEPENLVRGRIVRLDRESPTRDHWCHRLVAVEFNAPQPTLERVFANLAPEQAHMFKG